MPYNISLEIEWFEKEYSKEIALVKKHYGENAKVVWGVYTYDN